MKEAGLKKRGAGGRPPLASKGDVEQRLLDAATQLFLTLGFEGTSCDQVAQNARAGKASIYARYANKAALFSAVVDTNLAQLFDAGQAGVAVEAPLRQRMIDAIGRVIQQALQPDAVALLRLMVAEAPRLQHEMLDGESILHRIGVRQVALALAAPVIGSRGEAAVQAAGAAAVALLELALMPALLRALLGADLVRLRESAASRLPAAVDHLIATGMLNDWK